MAAERAVARREREGCGIVGINLIYRNVRGLIMNDKTMITEYMRRSGLDPALSGYAVIQSLIRLSVDNPSFILQDLIYEYLKENNIPGNEANFKRICRRATYCLKSSGKSTKGLYRFVKKIAVEITDALPSDTARLL